MANRLDLQTTFEEMLGSRNVYYNPPEDLKMEYPAIRYSIKDITSTYANDKKYSRINCYEVVVIGKKRNKTLIHNILDMPYCSYDRPYKADNLWHDVFTLYY